MSSRLAMKRLRRSDSSRMVADQIGLALIVRAAPDKLLERTGGADDGGERRLQIVRDRREQRRTQAIGLDPALCLIEIVHEMDALDRQRCLVDQGIKQAPLVGGEQRTRLVAVDTDDADDAAARAHGEKQPLGARQRIGAAPGRAVMLPGPFGRGNISLVENVLGRISGLDGKASHCRAAEGRRATLSIRGDLVRARPKHVVERADAGKLAAEGVERLGGARPGHGGYGERPHARRDVRYHHGNDGEEEERRRRSSDRQW